MYIKTRLLSLATMLVAVGACAAQTQMPAESPSRPGKKVPSASPTMPLTEGRVERIDEQADEIVLEHGDLPNLAMPPMTMAFRVQDKSVLSRLKKGDRVRFNAEIVKGEPTVTRIERMR